MKIKAQQKERSVEEMKEWVEVTLILDGLEE
jgi:hypothetical protein